MKFFALLVAVFVLFVSLTFLALDIGVNFTPSMPKGLYMVIDKEIERNDIVKFCLKDTTFINAAKENKFLNQGSCSTDLQPLLKIVAGVEGDRIVIRSTGIEVYYANQEIACFWNGIAKRQDSQGRELPESLLENGIIPKGKALVLTKHEGSFDSRYYGLVNICDLTTLKKLF